MRSDAATVEEYLDQLPDDRREALETVRATILANLPDGLEEVMNWGMITYQVPLEAFPDTYNGKPLMYAALASQKNHMAVYLTPVWSMPGLLDNFRDDYLATGKRLDMGTSCVRFRRLDDLPLDVIGAAIAAVSVEEFLRSSSTTESGTKRPKR
ncbi:MAG: DUF1801 domain-containing protein [Acidimicrobiia bacterium]|nr:DUF1801 domain-containing protein [Acidimicrobiia bacterium]